jgi:hypothetical protein
MPVYRAGALVSFRRFSSVISDDAQGGGGRVAGPGLRVAAESPHEPRPLSPRDGPQNRSGSGQTKGSLLLRPGMANREKGRICTGGAVAVAPRHNFP